MPTPGRRAAGSPGDGKRFESASEVCKQLGVHACPNRGGCPGRRLEIKGPKDLRTVALTVWLKNVAFSDVPKRVRGFLLRVFHNTHESCTRSGGCGIQVVCLNRSVVATVSSWKDGGGSDVLRLVYKVLNGFVVCTTLYVAAEFNKPGECMPINGCASSERRGIFIQSNSTLALVMPTFDTLTLSPPAYMQLITKAYPKTTFVLLHGSYSYTHDAGYLVSETSTPTSERYSPLLACTASALS